MKTDARAVSSVGCGVLRETRSRITHLCSTASAKEDHASRLTQLPVTNHQSPITDHHSSSTAFTLLEVMIACGIFFIAIFAILGLVSNCLRNARALRHIEVDAGMVAAQLYKTNRITEGVLSGDFGDTYHDYSWETQTQEAATNGLYQVDIVVRKRGLENPIDTMSVWIYSPESVNALNRSPFSNPRR